MFKFKSNYNNIKELREADRRNAELERLSALVAYLGMMTDVEIPTEEEEGEIDE